MTKEYIKEKVIREHIKRMPKKDNSRYGYIADYYNNSGDDNLTSTNKKYLVNMLYSKNYGDIIGIARMTGIFDRDFSKKINQLKDKISRTLNNPSRLYSLRMKHTINCMKHRVIQNCLSLLIEHDSVLIKEYTKGSR